MGPLRIGIIGITGWGQTHVRNLLKLEAAGLAEFTCFAEITGERSREPIEQLTAWGKTHYEAYTDMLEGPIDLAVICTPLPLHLEMALAAFAHMKHIYLEKPPVVLYEHWAQLEAARKSAGLACQVGFQNAASTGIKPIADAVRSGRLGKLKKIAAVGAWTRAEGYYRASPWRGALETGGKPVLDGSVMNPLSHLLNMSLFFAAELGMGELKEVEAELYRGHAGIASEDTCSARMAFHDSDARLVYYTTLCSRRQADPYIRFECERGYAVWGYGAYFIHPDGEPMKGPHLTRTGDLLLNLIRHLREGEPLLMPLERSGPFVLAANAIFASAGVIRSVPEAYILREPSPDGETSTILGIEYLLEEASRRGRLLSEMNVPWAMSASPVSTEDLQWDWKAIR